MTEDHPREACPSTNILLGNNESFVTKAVGVLLRSTCGDEFNLVEKASVGDFVEATCTTGFDLAIIYPNCLYPAPDYNDGLLQNAIRTIETIKATRPIPIIALTSMEEFQQPLLLAGADVCLVTPFAAEDFKTAVRRLIPNPGELH